ncbi:hypothetical protein BpHYR1_024139 [Brachionus plicatilis]|uniref:Uncharacterized protein n=1 Tax=Brachionus plicatilis TaxID=10195 RepID=A0A3M7TAL5_BRAPC|nr:hypothetical protein BpHYR1_024139 [Brachionus plicatilis]
MAIFGSFKAKTIHLKINFVITTLCNFQSCISYQGLENSANFAEIRFQCVQAQCILQRFCTSLADFGNKNNQICYIKLNLNSRCLHQSSILLNYCNSFVFAFSCSLEHSRCNFAKFEQISQTTATWLLVKSYSRPLRSTFLIHRNRFDILISDKIKKKENLSFELNIKTIFYSFKV